MGTAGCAHPTMAARIGRVDHYSVSGTEVRDCRAAPAHRSARFMAEDHRRARRRIRPGHDSQVGAAYADRLDRNHYVLRAVGLRLCRIPQLDFPGGLVHQLAHCASPTFRRALPSLSTISPISFSEAIKAGRTLTVLPNPYLDGRSMSDSSSLAVEITARVASTSGFPCRSEISRPHIIPSPRTSLTISQSAASSRSWPPSSSPFLLTSTRNSSSVTTPMVASAAARPSGLAPEVK